MIRETGWTVAEYRNQPMGDVFDILDHMNEQPPAHRILAWRYLKPTPSRSRGTTKPLRENEVGEMAQAIGGGVNPVPPGVRERAMWAQEQVANRSKGKKRKK